MALETATFVHQLNPVNPTPTDSMKHGDDHIRMVKGALKATFPNITGAVTATHDEINGVAARLDSIETALLWTAAGPWWRSGHERPFHRRAPGPSHRRHSGQQSLCGCRQEARCSRWARCTSPAAGRRTRLSSSASAHGPASARAGC
ncbi:MAG: hypothetical protein R3D03_10255 [Geminicoccaceae bacterium]